MSISGPWKVYNTFWSKHSVCSSSVSSVLWKETFSSVSGRFYLLSLRSGEKMSFPGWSTDLHISPNINISSQQHSNRFTWSDKVSSTKPARGVTNTQMSSGTHSCTAAWTSNARSACTNTHTKWFVFIFNVFCHFWSMTVPAHIHFHWISNILRNYLFIPQENENHSSLEQHEGDWIPLTF